MNLSQMVTEVRRALKDVDPVAYVFTTEEVESAIARAMHEYSQVAPRLASKLFGADGATRTFDVSAEAGFQLVAAVEHPVDEPAPRFIPFREMVRGVARVIGDPPAAGVGNVRVWYAANYDVAANPWTVPEEDLEVVELGAVAFLGLAAERYFGTRLAPTQAAGKIMADLAEETMRTYRSRLAKLGQRPLGVGLIGPAWGKDL